jgi:hypothetical protein
MRDIFWDVLAQALIVTVKGTVNVGGVSGLAQDAP